jgi:hypothetical protein
VAFLLLVLLVQVGVAMAAREAAQGAVATAARRGSRPGADLAAENARLQDLLESTVPAAGQITAHVRHHDRSSIAFAQFRVVPPGPDWLPLIVRVDARVALVIPP